MEGNRLKEARLIRGLTQAELGRLVGVGKSAISQYEHGLRVPETAVLARLAWALGVSADWLLGLGDAAEARASYHTANQPTEEEEADGFLAELCARAGAIVSRKDRRTLLEMARFLAQKGSSPEGSERQNEKTVRRRR